SLFITTPPPSSTRFPYTTLFRSVPLTELTNKIYKEVVTLLKTHIRNYDTILSVLDKTFTLQTDEKIYIGGKTNMLSQPEFHDIRSEEHTSELQSRENLVCRLLLE